MRLGHVAVRGAGLAIHAWGSDVGLVAVRLGQIPEVAASDGGIPVAGIDIASGSATLKGLEEALRAYLRGEAFAWDGARDERGLTEFQREVLDVVQEIPYAARATYAEVARRAGRPSAVRAVSNTLLRNPFPIVVPCHRVFRARDEIGGYVGDAALKRRFLAMEAGQTELDWGDA